MGGASKGRGSSAAWQTACCFLPQAAWLLCALGGRLSCFMLPPVRRVGDFGQGGLSIRVVAPLLGLLH